MTREEAIDMLVKDKEQRGECFISEAIDMAIKALEQIPKLQNRCHALTHGLMCVFCPYECEHKIEIEPQESEDV